MKLRRKIIFLFFAIILSLFVYFTFLTLKPLEIDKEEIIKVCIEECKKALSNNLDLNNGPCLLDPIPQYPDWVCDVAHFPRIDIDNLKENQCKSYLDGKSKHFVEVTPNCEFIRAV